MKEFSLQFGEIQRDFLNLIQAYLPRIIAALGLLLLGWLISQLLRIITFRIIMRVNRWSSLRTGLKDSGIQDITPKVVSAIIFWVSFLLFAASAVHVMGLTAVTGGLGRLAAYLPHLLAAFLVIAAGIVLGNLARAAVSKAAQKAKIAKAELLGESTRIVILIITVMIALDQAGIESRLLVMIFGLVLGGTILGTALAFGFGARVAVSNLLAARNLSRHFESNDMVRTQSIQGRIVNITGGSVIIQTAEGRARVPAKLFEESVVEIIDQKD